MPLLFDESAGSTAPSAFGTYRVLHQIGSGVLGPVFRTYDPQRDRLVAVKAFRLEVVPEQVARLADALRRLAAPGAFPPHPGLVPPLDAGLEGTTAYLASEYVAAETLDVALRHLAPAPLALALPILSQIADAIDAAWAAGVGHGALHPRDVFVTVDAQAVRLTGFGIVQAIESVGLKAPIRRPYTAPERVHGATWDIRADVFALGAIAHELLTRRRPAGAGEQDGALTTGTSPEQRVQIRRVLSAVLAEQPQHRFPSARAFVEALAAVARGEAIVALPADAEPVDARAPREVAAIAASEAAGPGQAALEGEDLRQPSEAAWDRSEAQDVRLDAAAEDQTAPEPAEALQTAAGMWGPLETNPEEASVGDAIDLHLEALGSDAAARMPSSGDVERLVPEPPPSRSARHSAFPWSAVATVAAAGIAVGLALGYYYGRDASLEPVAPVFEAGAAETEVSVPTAPRAIDTAEAEAPEPGDDSAADVQGARARGVARTSAVRGRVVVQSTPSGAMVLVDGQPRGQTPLTITDLALDRHAIEVARSGYIPYRTDVTLSSGTASRTLRVQLQPGLPTTGPVGSAALGSIFVDSRPQAARVLIDGRFVGTTPLRLPDVTSGRHVVTLERDGFRPVSTSVAVRSGEQARVTARLEER